MNSKAKSLLGITLLAFGALALYSASMIIQKNQSLSDSNALYGGELERGYPSAGYLISRETSGSIKTCGFAVLNNSIGITAAHCVDDSESIYIGQGTFSSDVSVAKEVLSATQKSGWVSGKERNNDFAILNYSNSDGYFQAFGEIAAPQEGCLMRVIAYGRTADPAEAFTKPRKSGLVCATDITNDTFVIQGKDSGICFGDSGSPIYYNGTNKVVGVVVSIILENQDESNPCAISNKAIVVRTDTNQGIINDVIAENAESGSVEDTVNVASGFEINVAEETFLQKLGLDNLSESDQFKILLYAAVSGLMLLIIIILILLRGGGKVSEAPSYYN
jgi:V8-like Glu-specific endopeptidase